jgi:hypothetical protein
LPVIELARRRDSTDAESGGYFRLRIAIEMKRLYSFSRAFIEDNDPGA